MGTSLVQLQNESGSNMQTERRQLVVSVTEPANELYNMWPLGQTQVPSSDVGRFINNAKEKEGEKKAAEVFCDDLRRRKIYTAD